MLRAGAAQVDVTPEPGVFLTGFAARTQPATGVHDPLYARALVLEGAGARAALGVADIIGFDDLLVARIRGDVSRAVGIPASHIMLAGTHTHSAPSVCCLPRMAPADPAVLERLATGMTEAIIAAARSAKPASIGAGFATGSIGVNRRQRSPEGRILLAPNPDGPVDPQVGMLRVEGKQGPICVMLNHACHGVVMGASNLLYSADWLGVTARALREAVGAGVAMVTNGACGDINPVERGDFDAVERQGAAIAGIGLGILDHIQLSAPAEIEVASRPLALPTRALTAQEAADELERSRASLDRAREAGDAGAVHAHEIMVGWAQDMADLAARGVPPEPVITEVQAIATDDIALLGLPGEVFCEIGMNIRAASPFRHTFVIGYANRSVGYLPTRQAFDEGGYEVEIAHRYYGFPPFTPDVQGVVEGAAVELLKSLR